MGNASSQHHGAPAQAASGGGQGQYGSRYTGQILGANQGQTSGFGQVSTGPQIGMTPPRAPIHDSPGPARVRQMLEEVPTIQNAVNLRPNTLRVVPREGSPNLLDITFQFDATKPCSVTTFVTAMEVLKTMELSTPKVPPPRVRCSAGLGQTFSDTAGRHCIDLSQYEEDALQNAKGNVFPLVVRLEVLESRQGKAVEQMPPGSAQAEWMQSQTTFAELSKAEDGSWGVKVLKQKIWYEGIPYELQEIYGLQKGTDAEGAVEDDESMTECIICMTNDRHMCLCAECARIMMSPNNPSTSRAKCPICRRRVHNFLSIKQGTQQGSAENV